jgi:hypothetical protein
VGPCPAPGPQSPAPTHTNNDKMLTPLLRRPVAVPLQVATDTDVFLVDLLALSGMPEALTAALGPLLGSERVYKLGVGVSSDIRKLGASYPQVGSVGQRPGARRRSWKLLGLLRVGLQSDLFAYASHVQTSGACLARPSPQRSKRWVPCGASLKRGGAAAMRRWLPFEQCMAA